MGDGGPGPGFGLHPLSHGARELDRLGDGYLATPFPHTTAWDPESYHPAFMAPPAGGALTEHEYLDDRWTAGSLVVADTGCGCVCRLVVTGPARGQVWCDNRLSDGGIVPDGDFRTWYETWLSART